jgi:hypothetical protein
MLSAEDIKRTCYEVMALGKIAGWQFKSLPVVQWEFPTISEYMRARMELLRAMSPELAKMVRDVDAGFRRVSGHTEELDCYGVTFRLICTQKFMTPHGPYGAADMNR